MVGLRSLKGVEEQLDVTGRRSPCRSSRLHRAYPWKRTVLIGMLTYAAVSVACVVSLRVSFWVALGVGLGAIWVLTYALPSVLMRVCYPSSKKYQYHVKSWNIKLGQVILLGATMAVVFGVGGGYYARAFYSADKSVHYANLGAALPPASDVGTAHFGAGAHPMAEFTEYKLSFLDLMAVCVAPILESEDQTTVNYWAVGRGHCCGRASKEFPEGCGSWDAPVGGVHLAYDDLYPKMAEARRAVLDKHSDKFDSPPDAVYLLWGDPEERLESWRNTMWMFAIFCTSVAALAILARSYSDST